MSKRNEFRVIISGGGVAGLTLANALQKANIDYILLERRSEISALVGASISLWPSGWRILDQLGMLEDLLKLSQPCRWVYRRDSNGNEIAPRSDAMYLAAGVRMRYRLAFMDRRQLVETLFDHLEDKSKVLLGKNVVSVEHSAARITVKCGDGSSYDGDVLVGADGVSSKTKQEMWRLAESTKAGVVSEDKTSLKASYKGLFGISIAKTSQKPGDFDWGYSLGRSSLAFGGPNGKTYFFMLEKLDQVYPWGKTPRYSKEEAAEYAKSWSDWTLRPNMRFIDVFEKSTSFNLAVLEEGKFQLWFWGRIALLGDSIHKMTLSIGSGGNAAIESAAAFTNELTAVLDRCGDHLPTEDEIKACLKAYQTRRIDRTGATTNLAGGIMRMQAMEKPFHRIVVRYLLPYLDDFVANALSDSFVNAELLDFLPIPEISLQGTMPFNPEQGEFKKESIVKRVLWALPFLGLLYLAVMAMPQTLVMPQSNRITAERTVAWQNGSVPIQFNFYNIKLIDSDPDKSNIFFAPALYGYDAVSRQQVQTFFVDYGVIYAIWSFESVRRANAVTLARLLPVFAIVAKYPRIGVVSSIYYFFHYVSSPVEKFKATDMRLTELKYSLALLPSMLLAYYLPGYAMLHWKTLSGRESWLYLWKMFPTMILLTAFVLFGWIRDTAASDKIHAPKRDLPVMRYTVGALCTLSAGVWVYTNLTSTYSFATMFVLEDIQGYQTDVTAWIRDSWKVAWFALFGNTFLWLGYLFWDMKHAGMVASNWFSIMFYAVSSTIVLGPGATVGLGWLWREEIITNKRHWAAVTDSTARDRAKRIAEVGRKHD